MKKTFTLIAMMLMVLLLPAQRVVISFEGMDGNDQAVQMDSVVVTNVTQNWTETVYAPDLRLILSPAGVEHYVQTGAFGLTQNRPNPFEGETRATLNVTDRGDVQVQVTDIFGRVVETRRIESPQEGAHELRVTLANAGLYFLTARQNGRTSTVKMVSRGNGGANSLEYVGMTGAASGKSQMKVYGSHPWDYGDSLQYVGYITVNDYPHAVWGQPMPTRAYKSLRETGSLMSQTVTLWFPTRDGTNCINNGYVYDYDNNSYIAMWVGHQCWMGVNLASRHYPDGTPIARGDQNLSNILTSYQTGYYYYPNGNPAVSGSYGLLYNSAAVMRGVSYSNEIPSGVQGICPNGWHVPSLAEWTLMLNYLNSRDEYVCNGVVGYNAKAMATKTEVWSASSVPCAPGNDPSSNGFADIVAEDNFYSGFDAFPAGTLTNGATSGFGDLTKFWSSFGILQDPYGYNTLAYGPWVVTNSPTVLVNPSTGADGCSVRCLRDEQETTPPTVATDSVKYYASMGRASCYGYVTSHGGAPVVQKGVCWGTGFNPTLAGNHVEVSSGSGFIYTDDITGLTEGIYHMRAYAKTAAGMVVYGNDVTLYYNSPSVRTDSVSIDPDNPNTIILHGTVTSMGSAQCMNYVRGMIYSSLPNPTVNGDDCHLVSNEPSYYHYHPGSFSIRYDNLESNTKYYVRAYARNGAGTVYGDVMEFTTGACHGQATMFDQDGNEYYTVGIGRQCWMKSNLATTHYADGTGIAVGSTSNPSTTIPYRYYPNNSSSNVLMYGYLYNLPAVMHGALYSGMNLNRVQGICPNGWHVPSENEFKELLDYVGHKNSWLCSSSGYHLDTVGSNVDTIFHNAKAMASTSGWSSSSVECSPGNNQNINNASGFNAMPAGWYSAALHHMSEFHEAVWFWCSPNVIFENNSMYHFYEMRRDKVSVERQYDPATYGMSVRCVKD
ncbi:MAG: T9SS type A sorting domain-containing protein [Bacteroidales bacterium]|nr:T9SS type A sorting domain-containing protein [Bacteroidales bacterium]